MELDLKANKLIEEIVAVIRSNLDKEYCAKLGVFNKG